MAAPDFFENFLLHDGLKALRPQENPLIVPLSRQRRYRQADTPQAASIRLWGRGGLASSPPVGAAFAPASVSPHYAGKSQVTRCPVLHEEPASGVNCEAATDIRIGVGWRLYQVAGEKARTNAIIPISAEVRLAPQIRKGYSVFVFDWLRRHRHKVPPF